MNPLRDHHHFKENLIESTDKVAKCERYVIDLLLNSSLPDAERENSIAWELKHHAGITQMGRVLARKRGLPIDSCVVGVLLHDIYAMTYGKFKEHAHLGAPIARQVLEQIGGFTDEEVSQVWRIIYNHSDKHVWADDPFEEFGKDVDTIDCLLYPGAFGYYLRHKSLDVFSHYILRAKKVWRELGIPDEPWFDILKNYSPNWFEIIETSDRRTVEILLLLLLFLSSEHMDMERCSPAFCIISSSGQLEFAANRGNWLEYVGQLRNEHVSTPMGSGVDEMADWAADALEDPPGKRRDIAGIPILLVRELLSLIPGDLLSQVDQLLVNAVAMDSLLMFWPAIDSYEVLHDTNMEVRLRELGLA